MRPSHHQQQQIRLAEMPSPGTLAKSFVGAAARKPVLSSLYIVGVLVALLGTGFKVTESQMLDYQESLEQAQRTGSRDLVQARADSNNSYNKFYNAKSWAIWNNCPDAHCQRLKERYELAAARVTELEGRLDEQVRGARQQVGIWSTVGVGEVRGAFWKAWNDGCETAKRWTMMDAVMMAITPGERERTLVHVIMGLVAQYVVNLTVGLMTALIFFMTSVGSLCYGYGESLFSGVAFFSLVFCAVCATFVSYMLLVGGVCAGGVYVVQKQEMKRLQAQQGGARGHVGNRAHYD